MQLIDGCFWATGRRTGLLVFCSVTICSMFEDCSHSPGYRMAQLQLATVYLPWQLQAGAWLPVLAECCQWLFGHCVAAVVGLAVAVLLATVLAVGCCPWGAGSGPDRYCLGLSLPVCLPAGVSACLPVSDCLLDCWLLACRYFRRGCLLLLPAANDSGGLTVAFSWFLTVQFAFDVGTCISVVLFVFSVLLVPVRYNAV
jgi:hypothetical protein